VALLCNACYLSKQAVFQTAIMNDTLFLSLVNVVDYSIVVGLDEDNHELVVGIIDYMRQYDIIKRVERMGKVMKLSHNRLRHSRLVAV
jgi:hypothetical protein